MLEHVLEPGGLLGIVVVGGGAAIVAAITAASRGTEARPLIIETVALAMVGAFLARTLVVVLLEWGGETREAGIVVGWAFLLWPGAIDTVAALFGAQLLTTPDRLPWIALVVGALTGLVDGIAQIRSWPLPSVVTFVLDTTWALAGATNGVLIHAWNRVAGSRAPDGRSDAHRYASGFHVKAGYAFTQGAVMSELSDPPGTPLHAHERTHVLQSRVFGPLYILTYIAWAALLFLPALLVALLRHDGVSELVEAWCYYDNPWEAWGYTVQARRGGGPRGAFGAHIWSDGTIIAAAVGFYAVAALVTVAIVSRVWL